MSQVLKINELIEKYRMSGIRINALEMRAKSLSLVLPLANKINCSITTAAIKIIPAGLMVSINPVITDKNKICFRLPVLNF
jgi:hypothetical protein